ncbi:bacillithiol biosynthesis cysteine-adding enzyme BshC [Capnocytophaga sp. ARDL2]|uniref:bacillithiol biosynthesis cysteine-adding enzyme BshC n=1 Tax=Capnocytophaga sp. ARDL2 TaxID=3238809 RepID=UPI0035584697
MKIQIPYTSTGYFSSLMIDYLQQNSRLKSLYHRFPTLENFPSQIQEKQSEFTKKQRQLLVDELHRQYESVVMSGATKKNINSLLQDTAFTITTGHQLNLFTGPLYFIYKIVSTINLCKQLQVKYPENQFVPVYWMATEDHDFEEINHFSFQGKKIQWNKEFSGAVGEISTEGLESIAVCLESILPQGIAATELKELFSKAYLQHSNLADATRYLVNELFSKNGLVIIDGNSRVLKREFAPLMREELLYQSVKPAVEKSFEVLQTDKIQVNPREINLFYLDTNLRERIVKEGGKYRVLNTDLQFSTDELLEILEQTPEKFSPNVILRPLYQEKILPNLCYIGGGGELAYWLELKEVFALHKVVFPMLLLRNSVLIASEKQNQKREKLELSWEKMFLKKDQLINQKTAQLSDKSVDFSQLKTQLQEQFSQLKNQVLKTDKSFEGAVLAQEAKQLKGLEKLEKSYFKAEKIRHQDQLQRLLELKLQLFPNDGLQERSDNFSSMYVEYGASFINTLLEELDPLNDEFMVKIIK